MLGFLLYESIDIVYHVGKMSVNGVYCIYKWYYNSNEKDKTVKNEENYKIKIESLEQQIQSLEEKYKNIEEKLKID
jgi:hypothetical protein